jgi:nitrous oxidase accessory protein
LKDIRDSEVMRNHFIKNTIAIHLEGVSRTQIVSNDFSQNGYAVRLQASSDDTTTFWQTHLISQQTARWY